MRRSSLFLAALLSLASLGLASPAHAVGTATVSGTVTDTAGTPVAGISVLLGPDGQGNYGNFLYGRTDADGRYAVTGVDAGSYSVGFQNPQYVEEWHADQPDQQSADLVAVADGATVTVDAALTRRPFIAGRVTNTAGDPVVGVCPTFYLGDPSLHNAFGGACTDETGNYRFVVPEVGTYRVEFPADGYYARAWYGGSSAATATAFPAGEVDATGIDVVLERDLTLVFGNLRGTVTDAVTGAPLQAVQVEVTHATGGSTYQQPDAEGVFTAWSTPIGSYRLTLSDYTGLHRDLTAEDVVVTEGETTVVELKMTPLPTISGRVVDESGAPIAGVCATFLYGDPYLTTSRGDRCTDSAGVFTYGAPEATTYRVRFDGPSFYSEWYDGAADEDSATRFTAGTDDVTLRDVVLRGRPSLTTTLRDQFGTPLAGCVTLVTLKGVELGQGCTEPFTEPTTGAVTLGGLDPGTYLLKGTPSDPAHLSRYFGGGRTANKGRQVKVGAGVTDVGVFELPLGGSITGTFTDAAPGQPGYHVCATVHPSEAWDGNVYGPGSACGGWGDAFTIVGLEPGSYPVQVIDRFGAHAPLFLPDQPDSLHSTRYRVGLGQNVTVNAVLKAGGYITGNLTDSGGEPAYGCVVARSARTGEQIAQVACGFGSYTVGLLGANSYKVELVYGPAGSTFYPNATTFRRASSVAVADGATTTGIDFTVS